MDIENFIQPVGYAEMYEWTKLPEKRHGLFVAFDKDNPEKIVPYNTTNSEYLGVSTAAYNSLSDDPDEWKYAFMSNEVGDFYLKKETLAVGIKEYDQQEEMSFIRTTPYEHYIRVPNAAYNKDVTYVKRSKRSEWVPVNLFGKVIVRDNGECVPGEYCTPYVGDDTDKFGIAIPYVSLMLPIAQPFEDSRKKFYILKRITDNTILIINKQS